MLGLAGRHADSTAEAARAFALDADSFFAHWSLVRSHAWAGDYERAIELAPALLRESGRHHWALALLAWTYGKSRPIEWTRAVYDEMEARSRHEFEAPFWLATAAASAGLEDRTIHYVERAVVEHDPLVLWGRKSLFWDGVREHPRFEHVVRGVWR